MANDLQEEQAYDLAQPEPSALIESLRAFGYSLKTALSDLIDNSIAAKAHNIWLRFEWDGGESHISVRDDGEGMNEGQLISAMRPGSQSPLATRSVKDLGRFGLGLKTASFSQCRRLTVITKTSQFPPVLRCWDLDYVGQTREWRLIKAVNSQIVHAKTAEIKTHGTVVLWEKMDRVTDNSNSEDDKAFRRFLDSIDHVKRHLGMVFHRFLEKSNGLKIWINDEALRPWDPFLKNEGATRELPFERLICNGSEFKVTPYILPHQSKISAETHKEAAGLNGWNAQQGFYVYRNERLLVGGEWLGLGFQKEEHCKLARIQIDLPNTLDDQWQIDVKKSRAKPPGNLKSDLKRIASLTRENAVQVYRHRGKILARKSVTDFTFLWDHKVQHGKHLYTINREHPLVRQVFQSIGLTNVEPLLRMLEETIPTSHINFVQTQEPEMMSSPFEHSNFHEIYPVMRSIYSALIKTGLNHRDSLIKISTMEPFDAAPELTKKFIDTLNEEQS